jgi:hypothetical protein
LIAVCDVCVDALLDDGLLDFTLLFGSPGKQVSIHAFVPMHPIYQQAQRHELPVLGSLLFVSAGRRPAGLSGMKFTLLFGSPGKQVRKHACKEVQRHAVPVFVLLFVSAGRRFAGLHAALRQPEKAGEGTCIRCLKQVQCHDAIRRPVFMSVLCLLDDGVLDFTLLFGSPGKQVRLALCMPHANWRF